MPWEYLLGSAVTGAGTVIALALMFWKKLVDRTVDSAFETRLEKLKSELSDKLETSKSELSVWAQLRSDVLSEIWNAHRQITSQMSNVILKAQEIISEQVDPYVEVEHPLQPLEHEFKPTVEEYRYTIHSEFHVIDPMVINDICQKFLLKSYELYTKDSVDYEFALKVINELKGIRNEFQRYSVKYFGLEKMMPWMVSDDLNN